MSDNAKLRDLRNPSDSESLTWLTPSPPPWTMRSLASILLALFAAVILFAAAVEIPETVTSSFVLAPVQGADPVRATRDGVVIAANVTIGRPVLENELLFEVRSESLGDRSSEFETQQAALRGAEQALLNEGKRRTSQGREQREELRRLAELAGSLGRQVAARRDEYSITLRRVRRIEGLAKQDLVSKSDLGRQRLELSQAKRALEEIEAASAENDSAMRRIRLEAETLEAEHRETNRRLLEEAERARIRIAALEQEHNPSMGSTFRVEAPCDGTVLQTQVKADGAFVREGEVLAEVACANRPLEAQLRVQGNDVALLEPGLGIKLLYDAFPFQRYGIRFATLRWVGPASIEIAGEQAFPAIADIEDTAFLVKGKERVLRAGMGGRARIVIGRRTLLSYAFEPLQRLRESVTDAPASGGR